MCKLECKTRQLKPISSLSYLFARLGCRAYENDLASNKIRAMGQTLLSGQR